MFACLQITKDTRLRRKPVPPALARVELPGGAPFFRLEAAQRKSTTRGEQHDTLPWDEIERAAGRLRTRMLFPEGIAPPPTPAARSAAQAQMEPGLRAFAPRRLPLLLCLRTAQQVLQASHVPARQLRVTVVDSKGALTRLLEPLVPLAGSLRVFTPDPSLYRAAAQQLQRRFGIALILSSSPGCFAQSHVVVADDLRLFTGREAGLIFTPDSEMALSGSCAAPRVVRCGAPVLPEAQGRLCPPGIDPMNFACALYELCGVKEIERLRFADFGFDGVSQTYTLEDLAGMVDKSCAAELYRG